MKSILFNPVSKRRATKLERGDKHDRSLVWTLSVMPGETFLLKKDRDGWIVLAGTAEDYVAPKPTSKKKGRW